MSNAAHTPEFGPHPERQEIRNPALAGGTALRLAEVHTEEVLREFSESLRPHESLGFQHLQHERAIIKRINPLLPEESEPIIASDKAFNRLDKYISQQVEIRPAGNTETGIPTPATRSSRRLLLDYGKLNDTVRQQLGDDHPANDVLKEYEIVARALTDRRTGERIIGDDSIRNHIFRVLTMMNPRGVRAEIDRQVEEGKRQHGS